MHELELDSVFSMNCNKVIKFCCFFSWAEGCQKEEGGLPLNTVLFSIAMGLFGLLVKHIFYYHYLQVASYKSVLKCKVYAWTHNKTVSALLNKQNALGVVSKG